MMENKYQVYGRKSHPQPLTFVGEVQTADVSALKDEAFKQFGMDGWVELIAFPVSAVVRVIPREESR